MLANGQNGSTVFYWLAWNIYLFISFARFAAIHARYSPRSFISTADEKFFRRCVFFPHFAIHKMSHVTEKRRMKTNHQIKLMTRQKFSRLSPLQPKAYRITFHLFLFGVPFHWLLKTMVLCAWMNRTWMWWTTEHLTRMAMYHRRRSLILSLLYMRLWCWLTWLTGWRQEKKKEKPNENVKCHLWSALKTRSRINL